MNRSGSPKPTNEVVVRVVLFEDADPSGLILMTCFGEKCLKKINTKNTTPSLDVVAHSPAFSGDPTWPALSHGRARVPTVVLGAKNT